MTPAAVKLSTATARAKRRSGAFPQARRKSANQDLIAAEGSLSLVTGSDHEIGHSGRRQRLATPS